jgi:chaperone modulatory protein CbpM
MSDSIRRDAVLLGDAVCLDLVQLARTCGTTTAFIEDLVLEGVLAPQAPDAAFTGDDARRVRQVMRLQREFDATLPSAALILDLLDEIERLRGELRRLGA